MSISFACECGKQLKVADEHAGKRAKCPACHQPVVVPALDPALTAATDPEEDAAFRALSEGPDPVPSSKDWREPGPAFTPSTPTRTAVTYTAKAPEAKRPTPKTKKIDYDPYAPPKRAWKVDWGQIAGGGLGVLLGGALLIGGLAAGRFFIWSPIILIGGIIGVMNGVFNVSQE